MEPYETKNCYKQKADKNMIENDEFSHSKPYLMGNRNISEASRRRIIQ